MKRILLLGLAFLVLASMSIGAQQVTLRVLDYADASAAGFLEGEAIWQKFQDDNPDIILDREILYLEPYHEKLGAYIAGDKIPDLMFSWPTMRSSSAILHKMKLLKDLAPLLGKEFLSNFNAPALNPNAQASKQLSILPNAFTYTTVMYTNKKLLADNGIALPKTYADLKAMVPKLKAKGIQTIMLGDVDGWPAQSCIFSTVVGRLLGDAWVDQAIAGKVKFTDAGFVNALTFWQTMFKDGVIVRDNITYGYNDSRSSWAAGEAAFIVDGDWSQGFYITDRTTGQALIDPALQATDYAYLNFPVIPGEKNPGVVSAIAGTGYGISAAIPKGSDKEKAAVRLFKYLYSAEVMKIRLEVGAFIPTRKGVTSELLDPFTQMMPKYYATIAKTCYVLDGVLDPTVNNTYLNKGLQDIGLGNKTPAQVAAEIEKAMVAWRASQ